MKSVLIRDQQNDHGSIRQLERISECYCDPAYGDNANARTPVALIGCHDRARFNELSMKGRLPHGGMSWNMSSQAQWRANGRRQVSQPAITDEYAKTSRHAMVRAITVSRRRLRNTLQRHQ